MSATTHKFQAEVGQVLHLVIHSLYSHKEIFLRELVSNASDALDKLRFRALTEPGLAAGDEALEIRLIPDREKKTLTIEDTGVGMTEAELAQNLGTVAHSGSRAFLEQLAKQGSEGAAAGKDKGVTLIGQFGVGFYSAYLVADRVDVVSRAAGSTEAFRWSSDGKDAFTIEKDERAERGTAVILHLRDDQDELLEEWRLRELVERYSDFVAHPIKLKVERKKDEAAEGDVFETINKASALWQRSKSEITDEQYAEFYRHLTHDSKPPLARTHFRVEGSQEFAALLFVPQQPEPDFFASDRKRGVRLFVKRVFIMEDCEELLPQWLRFVRGVVDSDDLPLNVSRETLQDSAAVRAIKKQLTKKVLDLLDEVAKERPDDYATFWKGHGSVLKTGLAIDFDHKERLGALLRYESSHTVDEAEHGGGLTSLADYVARMKEGQDAIYFVLGESVKALSGSPHLEALRARGYEVLYMTDPVDEWATDGLREYEGKKLVSAMRADLPPLDDSDDAKKAKSEAKDTLAKLTTRIQEVLGDKIREVRISDRLTDSPVCLVVGDGNHAYLERMLRERGHAVQKGKRILELNPKHPLVDSMRALAEADPSSERLTTYIETLYDQALVTEGSPIEDPARFAKNLTALLTQAAKA